MASKVLAFLASNSDYQTKIRSYLEVQNNTFLYLGAYFLISVDWFLMLTTEEHRAI